MFEIISPELMGMIIAIVLALNAFLFGAYKALEYIKDKTVTNADNSAYDLIGKILGYIQKILEITGNNTQPKAEEKKQ